MSEFDVEAFVARLERMGLKLTSVPLADGRLRVNRWRMMKAVEYAQQIQDLWATQIGDSQERLDLLAAHLAKAEPQMMANRIGPNAARAGTPPAIPSHAPSSHASSSNAPVSNAIMRASAASEPRGTAPWQMGAVPRKPAGTQPVAAPAAMTAAPPAAASQRLSEKASGVSHPVDAQAAPGAQNPPGLPASGRQSAAVTPAAAAPPPALPPGAA